MAPISMTLGDLEGHLPIAILQLTACSRGPSEVAAVRYYIWWTRMQ